MAHDEAIVKKNKLLIQGDDFTIELHGNVLTELQSKALNHPDALISFKYEKLSNENVEQEIQLIMSVISKDDTGNEVVLFSQEAPLKLKGNGYANNKLVSYFLNNLK